MDECFSLDLWLLKVDKESVLKYCLISAEETEKNMFRYLTIIMDMLLDNDNSDN